MHSLLPNRFFHALCFITMSSCGIASTAAERHQQQQPRYTSGPAGADVIGKRHLGREIAHVMGWQGAARLERGSTGARNAPTCCSKRST